MSMTIADIARIAGVSRATVSGVLNNNPAVSKKTQLRILDIMNEYNFKPNEIARALALNKTGILGLIVKDISNPLYSKIALGVEMVCEKHGYSVIIANTHTNYDHEVANVQLLRRRRADGLIIFPLQKDESSSHIKELHSLNYPFVLLAEQPGVNADLVRADDEEGAKSATEHFIKMGRKRIAYLSGPDYALANERRHKGYLQAIEQYQVDFSLVIDGGWRLEDGYRAGKLMIGNGNVQADAVFCYNDSVAIGFMRALVEEGIHVPEQIGIVGVDDAGVAPYLETALTTVAQPAFEIGKIAAQTVLDRIKSEDKFFVTRTTLLNTQMMIRETCGANQKGSISALI